MDQINHFLHGHPLVLTKKAEVNNEVVCMGCQNRLADPFYGCTYCEFYLHKSCAELPREIQNFFHPCPLVLHILSITRGCNVCFKHFSGFSYHCESCEFNMHVKCTQLPTMKLEREKVISHFTHWHPLTLVYEKKDLEVRCGICQKLCSDSWDSSCYGCLGCNFFLHTSCMITIPQRINHFFHSSGSLILDTTGSSYQCEGCDEDGSCLVFHCIKCDFTIDVKCALLPTVDFKGADKIQHHAHGHPLLLRESKEFYNEVWCRACGENCSALCFGCERCNFFLHENCAVEFPLETEIHHPFHSAHPLTLSPHAWDTDQCPAPDGRRDKFMVTYHCAKCDFNLHIDCAKPRVEHILFKYDGHPHFMNFCYKTQDKIYCDICDRLVCNCFLRCLQCELNIHLYCNPSTMKTIKHDCHLHSLTLTKSPFEFELNASEDKYNSDDEFYCDVCEEKRFKRESVYYCEECKFIAEIRCVISELLPSLITSKDQSGVDCRAIPNDENSALEAAIVELNDEIAALSAKEKPLEAEIKKYRTKLETLEEEIKPIKQGLGRLEKIHLRYSNQLNLDRNENKHPD